MGWPRALIITDHSLPHIKMANELKDYLIASQEFQDSAIATLEETSWPKGSAHELLMPDDMPFTKSSV